MLLKTDVVNLWIGTEKTMLIHSIGIILVVNGMILLVTSLRQQIKPHEVMFFVIVELLHHLKFHIWEPNYDLKY